MKKLLLALAILAAAAVAFTGGAGATPEIAEKEGKSCLVCHTGAGRPELNAQGIYYKEKGTLEGYEAPPSEPQPDPRPSQIRRD